MQNKRLGKQEKRILMWMAEIPRWHQTDKIADALVPDTYRHTPREWVSLKLRQLRGKGYLKDTFLGGNIKAWKITQEGIDRIQGE